MLAASIQLSGEPLSAAEVQDISFRLRGAAVRLLSVRGCRLSDRNFRRLCRGVAAARGLAQLNLNLGVVSSLGRARHLADAVAANGSLQTLLLHGSPLRDAGLRALSPALAAHPALLCLDLGDCLLGDAALALVCGMLPPDGAKTQRADSQRQPADHNQGLVPVLGRSGPQLPAPGPQPGLQPPGGPDCGHAGGCRGVQQNPGGSGPGGNRADQPVGAGVPGHGGELPHLPSGSGSGREPGESGAAAADQRPAVGGGGRPGGPAPCAGPRPQQRPAANQREARPLAPPQQQGLSGPVGPGPEPCPCSLDRRSLVCLVLIGSSSGSFIFIVLWFYSGPGSGSGFSQDEILTNNVLKLILPRRGSDGSDPVQSGSDSLMEPNTCLVLMGQNR